MHGLALLPVLAAFTNALYTITTRQLRDEDSVSTTLLYTSLMGAALSTAALPWAWVPPSLGDWGLMALAGALAVIGHLAFIRALGAAAPSSLAPLSYMVLLWSTGYGYLLFDDLPDSMTLMGASIIIGSGLYVLHRERVVTRTGTVAEG